MWIINANRGGEDMLGTWGSEMERGLLQLWERECKHLNLGRAVEVYLNACHFTSHHIQFFHLAEL